MTAARFVIVWDAECKRKSGILPICRCYIQTHTRHVSAAVAAYNADHTLRRVFYIRSTTVVCLAAHPCNADDIFRLKAIMINMATICIVDDDDDVRASLRVLLEAADYPVKDYPSADAFLSDDVFGAACLIADLCMPGMDGLELQHEISRRRRDLPIVFLSGLGQVDAAVRAMKAGAVDFLEKPFDGEAFLASIRRALAIGERERTQIAQAKAAHRLLASLTPRETDVMEKLVEGLSNKAVAQNLGISPRTVEVYRAQIMNKLKAGHLSDIVRMALAAKSEMAP